MSRQRYTEEFKIEAVKRVTERGLRLLERYGLDADDDFADEDE